LDRNTFGGGANTGNAKYRLFQRFTVVRAGPADQRTVDIKEN
jgi:hypothetical protein